jgi:hypothetical protein
VDETIAFAITPPTITRAMTSVMRRKYDAGTDRCFTQTAEGLQTRVRLSGV